MALRVIAGNRLLGGGEDPLCYSARNDERSAAPAQRAPLGSLRGLDRHKSPPHDPARKRLNARCLRLC